MENVSNVENLQATLTYEGICKILDRIRGDARKLADDIYGVLPQIEQLPKPDSASLMGGIANISEVILDFARETYQISRQKRDVFYEEYRNARKKIIDPALRKARNSVGQVEQVGNRFLYAGEEYYLSREARKARKIAITAEAARIAGVEDEHIENVLYYVEHGDSQFDAIDRFLTN